MLVDSYKICYALKKEMIRVLHRRTATRALVRGHTGGVVDLSFFENVNETGGGASTDATGPELDLLASTAKDGNIFVWKLSCTAPDSVVYLAFPLLLSV